MAWVTCSDQLPDADEAVMTYSADSCEPVWPGAFDGECWRDLADIPFTLEVTHWMPFPEGPAKEQ